ncbi:hypothetical protein D7Y41_32045 [Anaerotruncus sp. 1XD22-93]|nr:hypothetical protein [Lachnospiraceae bacterium]NBI76866.1 hypothetical protein [Lachnospiraceae bacterium]RKJ76314.1 hypothetical protein D7Y41_32045 [Anaerotruncus sp. 1XD22-93]
MRRYASVATVFLIAGRYRKYRRYRRKPTHGGAVKRRKAVHRPLGRKSPRQGAKALLIERSLSKVLLRYFRRK